MSRPPLSIPVARAADGDRELLAALANRHGLVAGATGTGKTVTLRVLAEGFSRIGVPVFLADVKGDLSGLALPGERGTPRCAARVKQLGLAGLRRTSRRRWSSGTSSASRGIRSAPPSPRWGRCCSRRMLELNDIQEGVLSAGLQGRRRRRAAAARPEGPAGDAPARRPSAPTSSGRSYGNVSRGERRRHPARAPHAGAAGRRQVLRRAGARPRRPHADGERTGAAS